MHVRTHIPLLPEPVGFKRCIIGRDNSSYHSAATITIDSDLALKDSGMSHVPPHSTRRTVFLKWELVWRIHWKIIKWCSGVQRFGLKPTEDNRIFLKQVLKVWSFQNGVSSISFKYGLKELGVAHHQEFKSIRDARESSKNNKILYLVYISHIFLISVCTDFDFIVFTGSFENNYKWKNPFLMHLTTVTYNNCCPSVTDTNVGLFFKFKFQLSP